MPAEIVVASRLMTCPAPSIAIPFLITLILAKLLGISLELLMMLYAFFA